MSAGKAEKDEQSAGQGHHACIGQTPEPLAEVGPGHGCDLVDHDGAGLGQPMVSSVSTGSRSRGALVVLLVSGQTVTTWHAPTANHAPLGPGVSHAQGWFRLAHRFVCDRGAARDRVSRWETTDIRGARRTPIHDHPPVRARIIRLGNNAEPAFQASECARRQILTSLHVRGPGGIVGQRPGGRSSCGEP